MLKPSLIFLIRLIFHLQSIQLTIDGRGRLSGEDSYSYTHKFYPRFYEAQASRQGNVSGASEVVNTPRRIQGIWSIRGGPVHCEALTCFLVIVTDFTYSGSISTRLWIFIPNFRTLNKTKTIYIFRFCKLRHLVSLYHTLCSRLIPLYQFWRLITAEATRLSHVDLENVLTTYNLDNPPLL